MHSTHTTRRNSEINMCVYVCVVCVCVCVCVNFIFRKWPRSTSKNALISLIGTKKATSRRCCECVCVWGGEAESENDSECGSEIGSEMQGQRRIERTRAREQVNAGIYTTHARSSSHTNTELLSLPLPSQAALGTGFLRLAKTVDEMSELPFSEQNVLRVTTAFTTALLVL